MTKITSPISILEFGSTHVRLAIYDKLILNQSLFYEEKIDFTSNENSIENHPIFNLIMKAEKDLGQHLNEVLLLVDSSSIHSLDFSIQKNYDKKIVTNEDINYLINESKQVVKNNNQEQDILHIIKSNIIFDNKSIEYIDNISEEVSKANVELKIILINTKICNLIKNLFIKKHISLKNIFCTSYIKSLGLINKNGISGYSSFIDIGLNKSSLTIFKEDKLLYLNNTHIGGNHVTKDISKVLKIDYRKAEAKKLKFSKNNQDELQDEEQELLKQIINSRLEEIVELLFLNCPLVKNNIFNSDLKLFFTGNGSRVLNESLLSFGPEFRFINEMSIIDELKKDACDSAIAYITSNEKKHTSKPSLNLENKGFFERLFEYFSKK
tara:strand:+ start:2089 stop:3231 length:1143 start_codon:yes stop_codon:yes gene_type:complete